MQRDELTQPLTCAAPARLSGKTLLSVLLLVSLLVAALLAPAVSFGRTPPRRGATHKPAPFQIRSPFPCGTRVRLTCAYGPGCSPAHKRVAAPSATNDYYALDLTRAEDGNGAGKPIVAIAAGVVRYAGWARGGWSPYGRLVYIEHDFRDGKGRHFHSLYAHLRDVRVRSGERVSAGVVIGTLGGSSKGRQNVFGPHLHFALYRDARDTLGGGHAVVPEPLEQLEDLRQGMQLTACAAPAPAFVASSTGAGDEGQPAAAGGLTR